MSSEDYKNMTNQDALRVSSALLSKARKFGADLVGFAAAADLKKAPSFTFAPQMPGAGKGIGTRNNELGLKPGEVSWPETAKTVMVIAVHHPEDKPEMDWWFGRVDPPGNRVLAKVAGDLCIWIPERFGIKVFHLPYHVEKRGDIFEGRIGSGSARLYRQKQYSYYPGVRPQGAATRTHPGY